MNRSEWFGFAVMVAILASGYFQVRAERKSRVTQNGHPILDSALLLGSGILLIGFMGMGFWLFDLYGINANTHWVRFLSYVILLVIAGGLWWLCNLILRRARKRGEHR